MTGTDVVAIRAEIAEAKSRGDTVAANAGYARELAALAKPAARSPSPVAAPSKAIPVAYDAATVNRGLAKIEDHWGKDARRKFEAGTMEPGRVMAAADAVALAFPRTHQVANEEGLTFHPGFIRIAAALAHESAVVGGNWNSGFAPPARKGTSMSDEGTVDTQVMSEDAYQDALRGVRKEISEARAERDTPRAQRLYQREMAMIAKRQGNGPIIGRAGRTS